MKPKATAPSLRWSEIIGGMKVCIAVLLLFLTVWCVPGRAQTATPSITIGAHVFKLGMKESSVLKQFGTDLEFDPIQHPVQGMASGWYVSRKTGPIPGELTGYVYFDASHHLAAAGRRWEIQDASSKSLFYAISEATKNLERDGLTACQISTHDASQILNSPSSAGSVDMKEILIDCGIKQIRIDLSLSDVPGMVPSEIEVSEWLKGK